MVNLFYLLIIFFKIIVEDATFFCTRVRDEICSTFEFEFVSKFANPFKEKNKQLLVLRYLVLLIRVGFFGNNIHKDNIYLIFLNFNSVILIELILYLQYFFRFMWHT